MVDYKISPIFIINTMPYEFTVESRDMWRWVQYFIVALFPPKSYLNVIFVIVCISFLDTYG